MDSVPRIRVTIDNYKELSQLPARVVGGELSLFDPSTGCDKYLLTDALPALEAELGGLVYIVDPSYNNEISREFILDNELTFEQSRLGWGFPESRLLNHDAGQCRKASFCTVCSSFPTGETATGFCRVRQSLGRFYTGGGRVGVSYSCLVGRVALMMISGYIYVVPANWATAVEVLGECSDLGSAYRAMAGRAAESNLRASDGYCHTVFGGVLVKNPSLAACGAVFPELVHVSLQTGGIHVTQYAHENSFAVYGPALSNFRVGIKVGGFNGEGVSADDQDSAQFDGAAEPVAQPTTEVVHNTSVDAEPGMVIARQRCQCCVCSSAVSCPRMTYTPNGSAVQATVGMCACECEVDSLAIQAPTPIRPRDVLPKGSKNRGLRKLIRVHMHHSTRTLVGNKHAAQSIRTDEAQQLLREMHGAMDAIVGGYSLGGGKEATVVLDRLVAKIQEGRKKKGSVYSWMRDFSDHVVAPASSIGSVTGPVDLYDFDGGDVVTVHDLAAVQFSTDVFLSVGKGGTGKTTAMLAALPPVVAVIVDGARPSKSLAGVVSPRIQRCHQFREQCGFLEKTGRLVYDAVPSSAAFGRQYFVPVVVDDAQRFSPSDLIDLVGRCHAGLFLTWGVAQVKGDTRLFELTEALRSDVTVTCTSDVSDVFSGSWEAFPTEGETSTVFRLVKLPRCSCTYTKAPLGAAGLYCARCSPISYTITPKGLVPMRDLSWMILLGMSGRVIDWAGLGAHCYTLMATGLDNNPQSKRGKAIDLLATFDDKEYIAEEFDYAHDLMNTVVPCFSGNIRYKYVWIDILRLLVESSIALTRANTVQERLEAGNSPLKS